MPRILLEDTFEFKPNRQKIRESVDAATGLKSKIIPGRLSVCDCINGNKRKYPKKVWEKNLSPDSPLSISMKRRASFGLLEHPKDGQVTLNSPISHLTVNAKLVEENGEWVVEGDILVLEGTPEGRKLIALIDAGYDPLVSSRGYGSLTSEDGIDIVQDDYVCEGWDIVSKPSFEQAQLRPLRSEKKEESINAPSASATVNAVRESTSSTPVEAALKAKSQPAKTMDITQIKEKLQSLNAVDPATLSARSFAEGLATMAGLHQEASKALAGDATLSWEVSKLHEGISAVENKWTAAFEAPRAEVKQLKENQTKLLQTLKAVAGHAVNFKKTLSENRKKGDKLIETVTGRGRRWMERANDLRGKSSLLEKKYVFATDALDVMRDRYFADVSELGRHIVGLEFPNLTEDQKKQLAEAKTPKAVAAFRNKLEEAKKAATPAKVTESKADDKKPAASAAAAAVPAKIEEKKDAAQKPAEAPAAPAESSAPRTAPVPIAESDIIFRQGGAPVVNESISMARRLSKGQSSYHA